MRKLVFLCATTLLAACSAAPSIEDITRARTALIAMPKAHMKVEQGVWTHAPQVPPSITRRKPRIVEVRWHFKSAEREIAPGVVYKDAWTIEGSVPGPMLRLRVGDVLRLHLTNDDPFMLHNLDFHAVLGPGGGGRQLSLNQGKLAFLKHV
ncbi:hypothetical protein HY413_03715 [Candidatus Kaiserbacteria bacterium]|nr:hypothetical protein [Candidatus Kaiserbacteria bacterium]